MRVRPLPAGLAAGLIGAGLGLYIRSIATGQGYEWFPLYAGLAAFAVTFLAWWLVMVRWGKRGPWAGALAGAASGGLAHYVCWYLQILSANACYLATGGCLSSLGEPPVDPLTGLAGALVLSLASLVFFGWVTVPVGALFGALLGYRR